MLQVLQNGLHKAALDCITCNLHSFQDGKSSQHLSLYWAFLGGCPEASLFMNTLGDANMLVRKPVFKAVGGFREPLVTVGRAASEDLMLLVRIAIAGYRMDCSSSILLAYRHRSGSASAKANKYWQRVAILNAFTEGMEPWMKNLFLHQFGDPTRVKKETSRIRAKLQQYREKYHAEREKRRERERNATVKKNRLLMKIRSSRYLGSIIRAVKGKR